MGNDVVDLRDPDAAPGARHARFDARVFTRAEREALARPGAPAELRWMLWAAKEAAYKVARKLDARAVFSPRRFAVRLDAAGCGEVRAGTARFPVRVEIAADAVHAVAGGPGADPGGARREVHVLAAEEGDASAAVRARAARALAPALGAAPGELRFAREGRIPRLLVRGRPAPADVSLSHHGRVVAWACELGHAARGSRAGRRAS